MSFIIIFSLTTSISNIIQSLVIVKITVDHAGHLIHVITSFNGFFSVISLQSTFIIKSHHFNQAFSDGDHGIGETILTAPGFSISTYDQIHSYSQERES
jgi:hypothetical protein